jgi:hypothetical protein
MFLAKNARAEEVPESPPASQPTLEAAAHPRLWEVRLLGGYGGYSNYSGWIFGGSSALAISLSPRWQWEWGAAGGVSTKGKDWFSVFTGPRFNLSEDRSRSWFAGAGVEYGDRWMCCKDDKQMNGYFEVGKRFRVNDSGSWAYAPSAQWSFDGDYTVFTVRPLTFTYSF